MEVFYGSCCSSAFDNNDDDDEEVNYIFRYSNYDRFN